MANRRRSDNQDPRGWIYIQTHPLWEGMIKVGKTGRDPKYRAAEIGSASGLLVNPEVYYCVYVPDMHYAERRLHQTMAPYRAQKNRELFAIKPADAANLLDQSHPFSVRAPVLYRRRHQRPSKVGLAFTILVLTCLGLMILTWASQ
jgi:T5orf172 domain